MLLLPAVLSPYSQPICAMSSFRTTSLTPASTAWSGDARLMLGVDRCRSELLPQAANMQQQPTTSVQQLMSKPAFCQGAEPCRAAGPCLLVFLYKTLPYITQGPPTKPAHTIGTAQLGAKAIPASLTQPHCAHTHTHPAQLSCTYTSKHTWSMGTPWDSSRAAPRLRIWRWRSLEQQKHEAQQEPQQQSSSQCLGSRVSRRSPS